MRCPFCGNDNIPGVELCESCGSELAGLDIPEADSGFAGRLMSDSLGDLELTPKAEVAPDATAAEAIERMRRERHGCVQVVDDGRLVGIFTERDVLARLVRTGLDPSTTPVSQVMTPGPTTLTSHDPPAFAIHRMVSQGFRHLPIVDGGELRGSISVRNLLRYIHSEILGASAG